MRADRPIIAKLMPYVGLEWLGRLNVLPADGEDGISFSCDDCGGLSEEVHWSWVQWSVWP